MALKTQGTRIYVVNPTDESLVTVGCPTQASFSGRTTEQIETTCLEDDDRTYVSGLNNPGSFTFTILLDPSDTSHAFLQDQQDAGTTLLWAIGLSDGTSVAPTVDSGGTFDLGTGRSWRRFSGNITDYSEDFSTNTVIEASITVQITGSVQYIEKV